MANIGFIGLGIMGTPMAANLLKGEHTLHVHTRGDVPATLIEAGAKVCATGGEVGAKAASLTIMVGGPQAPFERVRPLFELMGKNITLVGGNGDGQITKAANHEIGS